VLVRRLGVVPVPLLREDLAALPLEREPALLAADERFEADLARVDAVLRPPELARDAVLRPPELARDEVFRAPDARRPLPRVEPDDAPALALPSPSTVHLPDITRCAASATASAMIDPSLVALDITLFAACEAVSAASSPASRILRRAAGLALIAAAAAARPAASISLLIAAFASLSRLSLLDLEELDEPEELLLGDLAIRLSPCVADKTLKCRDGSLMK
jgi:hypothetical protein